MRATQQAFRWLLVSALLICSYGFLKDVSGLPSTWLPNDKIMHLLIFLMLTTLWQLSFNGKTMLGAALFTIYGGGIELMQHYFTVRTGDWWDWLADICGIVLALWCWKFLPDRYKPSPKNAEIC